MDKISEWAKTCLSKSKLNETIADKIIKRAEIKLYKYHCPHCFSWHITSKKPKKNV